jgi:NADH dehydrogenase [ubiquinone] 1 alpha subcomplex assembly factor 6
MSNRLTFSLQNKFGSIRSLSTNSSRTGSPKQLKTDFEYCVDFVQNRDRESYLCGLLMPETSRRAYFAVRAFNVELASIKDGSISRKVGGAKFEESGASMALKIRVQWWREALNQIYGDSTLPQGHSQDIMESIASSYWKNPVVRMLDHAVQENQLTRRFLERLLEAREADLDVYQVDTMNDAIVYAESTSSSLLYLSLECTGVSDQRQQVRCDVRKCDI